VSQLLKLKTRIWSFFEQSPWQLLRLPGLLRSLFSHTQRSTTTPHMDCKILLLLFNHSVIYNFLWPMDCMQHTRHPCPSLSSRAQTHIHWIGMPSNHLILCRPLLLLPSILPSIRVFSSSHVRMWELGHKEGWALKSWFSNCGAQEDSWESLGVKGIKPVSPKGYQPWIFTGRTDAEAPILWPPD